MADNLIIIWKDFIKGDQIAFKKLYDSCFDNLFLYGHQFSKDPETIKDIIQNIFIKIWERKQSLKNVLTPKAYLMQVFRNQMLNHIRSNKNNPISNIEIEEEHYSFSLEIPVELSIIEKERDNEVRKKLKLAIDSLTSKQKELIYLKYIKNMEFNEISSIMKITTKSVYKLHNRTMVSLKNQMGNIDLLTLISYLNWAWILYK